MDMPPYSVENIAQSHTEVMFTTVTLSLRMAIDIAVEAEHSQTQEFCKPIP